MGMEVNRQVNSIFQCRYQTVGSFRFQEAGHIFNGDDVGAGILQFLSHIDIVCQVVFIPRRIEDIAGIADGGFSDLILIEQVDRLSRLDDEGWQQLKRMMQEKNLAIISLDLPTSYAALMPHGSDEFTRSMLTAINSMMLDMLAAIARKDYTDRRRRQQEGVKKAKEKGVYRGRMPDQNKHDLIRSLRHQGKSISETARLAGVSERTVTRVSKS